MFMNVDVEHFLTLTTMLFVLGMVGIFLNRRNIIVILMCLELMLLAVNINFVAFGYFWEDLAGQVFTFFILTVAAAEVAIGLAILTLFFRNRKSAIIDAADMMKGECHGHFVMRFLREEIASSCSIDLRYCWLSLP